MLRAIAAVLLAWSSCVALGALSGCGKPGEPGEDCLPDGTCTGKLECVRWGGSPRCQPPSAPPPPQRPDAERFCAECLRQCGTAGLRACEFADTTVWGSKPTRCECRSEVRQ